MRRVALSAFALGVVLSLSFVARAEEARWKTIRIDGRSDFTIDIPAAIDEEQGLDTKKGDFMAFFGTSDNSGDIACFLNGYEYPAGSSQKTFADGFPKGRGQVFCEDNDSHVSGGVMLESNAQTSNGHPAAVCTSSYTKSDEKKPGMVTSELVIATPKRAFMLNCTINDEDQEAAETSWQINWQDDIAHIRDSLKLSKDDK